MKKLVVIYGILSFACSGDPKLNSKVSVGSAARTEEESVAKKTVVQVPAEKSQVPTEEHWPQQPQNSDVVVALTEKPADESVTPPAKITGIDLICSKVSINPADFSEGSVECLIQQNGQKFDLPAGLQIIWGSRNGGDLVFTFNELPASAAAHVSVLIHSPSERLQPTVVQARITATVGDQSLESAPLVLPSLPRPILSPSRSANGVDLRWTSVNGAAGFLLVRTFSGLLPKFTPANGSRFSPGSVGDETIVFVGPESSFFDSSVLQGVSVGYTVYAFDQFFTYTRGGSVVDGG